MKTQTTRIAPSPERGAASAATSCLRVVDIGRVAYDDAWKRQQAVLEARRAGLGPDTLLICEHDPVITTGRGTTEGWQRDSRFPVINVERGGEATYHGPGQVVLYPIVALAEGARDLHRWMRALEQAAIDACAMFGVAAGRRAGATGVWIDGEAKLASIGVAARGWVTWHGMALNHETDLSHFEAIQPCGFDADVMTSLSRELGDRCPDRETLVTALVEALQRQLAPFTRDMHTPAVTELEQ